MTTHPNFFDIIYPFAVNVLKKSTKESSNKCPVDKSCINKTCSCPTGEIVEYPLLYDIYVYENKYHISVSVPGIEKPDIKVLLNSSERTLLVKVVRNTIKADIIYEQNLIPGEYVAGPIALLGNLNLDDISTSHKNGVIDITFSIKSTSEPREIKL
jgi:HSP20 family molecular chaperone IbpA